MDAKEAARIIELIRQRDRSAKEELAVLMDKYGLPELEDVVFFSLPEGAEIIHLCGRSLTGATFLACGYQGKEGELVSSTFRKGQFTCQRCLAAYEAYPELFPTVDREDLYAERGEQMPNDCGPSADEPTIVKSQE